MGNGNGLSKVLLCFAAQVSYSRKARVVECVYKIIGDFQVVLYETFRFKTRARSAKQILLEIYCLAVFGMEEIAHGRRS